MAADVYVGIGSNLGDSRQIVVEAARQVLRLGFDGRVSSVYRTAARGGLPQPPYYNMVALISTAWSPLQLLDLLLGIESRFGRTRRVRWGPRTLDLDLLVYDGRVVREPGLLVPHPRLQERRFVLDPLLEVAPQLTLPDGRSVRALQKRVLDQEVSLL